MKSNISALVFLLLCITYYSRAQELNSSFENKDIYKYSGNINLSAVLNLNQQKINIPLYFNSFRKHNIHSASKFEILNPGTVNQSPKLTNMGLEFLVGVGMGFGFGAIGAMIGSVGHVVGDTSSSNSDAVARVELVLFCIGHAAGSIGGTLYEADNLDGKGSVTAAVTAGVLGETLGLFLVLKNHDVLSGTFLAVGSSLLGTLAYNIFRKGENDKNGNSSLIYYKKGELSFRIPEIIITQDNKSKNIINRVSLLTANF